MASFWGNLAEGMGKGLLQYAAIQQQGQMDAIRQASLEKRWKRQDDMQARQEAATAEYRQGMMENSKAQLEIARTGQADLASHRAGTLAETNRHNLALEEQRKAEAQMAAASGGRDKGMDENEYAKLIADEKAAIAASPEGMKLEGKELEDLAIRNVDNRRSAFKGGHLTAAELRVVQANPDKFKDATDIATVRARIAEYNKWLETQNTASAVMTPQQQQPHGSGGSINKPSWMDSGFADYVKGMY